MERLGWNPRRRRLLDGLADAIDLLEAAGCRRVWLDGSFVTAKEEPGDFDACWDPDGVDLDRLDPIFFDFADGRAAQKHRFGGEFFPMSSRLPAAWSSPTSFRAKGTQGARASSCSN